MLKAELVERMLKVENVDATLIAEANEPTLATDAIEEKDTIPRNDSTDNADATLAALQTLYQPLANKSPRFSINPSLSGRKRAFSETFTAANFAGAKERA